MKKKLNKYIWCEKYRPESVKDIILPSSFKRFFNKIIKDGDTTNLFLYSSTPGTGKTTTAKALCRDMDFDYKYINISNDSGIDVLRTQIQKFASTMSFDGKSKAVIMDEFDGATPKLQDALRADIEKYHKTCRFIFTCNYISKIIQPLREGRTTEFDFSMNDKKIVEEMKPKIFKRILGILKFEKVECDEEVVKKLVDTFFPNIRKMLSLMQKYSTMNGIIDSNIFSYTEVSQEFYDLILEKKFTAARKHVIESSYDYSELYTNLFRDFVPQLNKSLQAPVILNIAEYMHRHPTSIDPEINFSALIIEIMALI